MACCLTAPRHYLNQCWLNIREVPWHSSGGIIIRRSEETNHWNTIKNYSFEMAFRSPRGQWVKCIQPYIKCTHRCGLSSYAWSFNSPMTVWETMCIISNFTREYVILYIWNDFIINCYWILLVVVFVICTYCHQWAFPSTRDPFYEQDFTFIRAWMSNHTPTKVWNEITYPFPNFNCVTVAVWKWISNFIPHFIMDGITYPCWDWN